MTIKERNDFADAIWEAIENDEYLYDLLPGNGEDDWILETIRKIINKTRLETPPSNKPWVMWEVQDFCNQNGLSAYQIAKDLRVKHPEELGIYY